MDNYQRINTNVIVTECMLYSMLLGECNCNSKYNWKNLTTNVIKTGAMWKSYFVQNPPNCTGGGGATLYGETVIAVAGSIINMVNIGTAFSIAWDNTILTFGWVQAGQVITLPSSSYLSGGEIIRIFYT